MSAPIEIGTRVAYSRAWLQTTEQHGPIGLLRGKVIALDKDLNLVIAIVRWDDGHQRAVNVQHLESMQ